MTEKLLEIKNLHVIYETDEGTVYAVNGLNLTMNKGETLGLVGETGAGKTTTALSIMKLLPEKVGVMKSDCLTFGSYDIGGASKEQMRLLRGKEISMIFQDPMTSLNPVITVGDQIAEVLEFHYIDKAKASISGRVDEILELVGLSPERKTDYPHQFSGGMKQRVVIAMALACEPKLLLADEPTTALDVTIQAQVLDMMKKLKEKLHTSMLLITHDLGVVAKTCDRVAIMYAGEVIEMGTVEQIFEGDNHHPYTVGLFGSIPDLTKIERRLKPIEGLMPDPTKLHRGCPFYARCPERMEICETKKPGESPADSHMIKCHLYTKTEGQLQEGMQ